MLISVEHSKPTYETQKFEIHCLLWMEDREQINDQSLMSYDFRISSQWKIELTLLTIPPPLLLSAIIKKAFNCRSTLEALCLSPQRALWFPSKTKETRKYSFSCFQYFFLLIHPAERYVHFLFTAGHGACRGNCP